MNEGAAPGWYRAPDVEHQGQERYWDGEGWLPSWRPVPPAAKDDPAYAWTLALLPLVGIGCIYLVPRAANYIWIGVLVVNIVLGVLDEKQQERNGFRDRPAIVGAFLIPIYLIDRTRKIGSTAGIPIAWLIAFAAYIVVSFVAPTPFDVDTTKIDSQLARQIEDATGVAVTVDCPAAKNQFGGDSIRCSVAEPGGVTEYIRVTFRNDSSYAWSVESGTSP